MCATTSQRTLCCARRIRRPWRVRNRRHHSDDDGNRADRRCRNRRGAAKQRQSRPTVLEKLRPLGGVLLQSSRRVFGGDLPEGCDRIHRFLQQHDRQRLRQWLRRPVWRLHARYETQSHQRENRGLRVQLRPAAAWFAETFQHARDLRQLHPHQRRAPTTTERLPWRILCLLPTTGG